MVERGDVPGILGHEKEVSPEGPLTAQPSPTTDRTAQAIAALQSDDRSRTTDAAMALLARTLEQLDIRLQRLEDADRPAHDQRRSPALSDAVKLFGRITQGSLQVSAALITAVIGIWVLIVIYGAIRSHSVVVAPFKAPAALAGRGLTGDVVAAGVRDALQTLRETTHAAVKGLDIEGTWAPDLKIEVPDTGLSIEQADRLLKMLFGHDLNIGGDLVQTNEGGLTLTVRGDGVSPRSFTGGADELGVLTVRAAEYVYGRSQPAQYALYLVNNSRYRDVLAFVPDAFARADTATLQADLSTSWGDALAYLDEPRQSVEKYRMALALKPYDWEAWGDLTAELALAQGEKAAWQEGQRLLQAARRAPESERPELRLLYYPAAIARDLPLMLSADLQDALVTGDSGAMNALDAPSIADTYAQMHDPTNAARYMSAGDPEMPLTKAEALLIASYTAFDRGDSAAAVTPLEAFWAAWQADPTLQATYLDDPCLLGLAYGLGGRVTEAAALFDRMRPWSRCFAYRGDVLEHAGDLEGAERVWAQGLSLVSDAPWIYLHRGLSALHRGDLKRAAADLAAANGSAPHWADPLKAWGDTLIRDGRYADALAKYDEALKFAPGWEELLQARESAARHRSGAGADPA
jgi:hypothetical protein